MKMQKLLMFRSKHLKSLATPPHRASSKDKVGSESKGSMTLKTSATSVAPQPARTTTTRHALARSSRRCTADTHVPMLKCSCPWRSCSKTNHSTMTHLVTEDPSAGSAERSKSKRANRSPRSWSQSNSFSGRPTTSACKTNVSSMRACGFLVLLLLSPITSHLLGFLRT